MYLFSIIMFILKIVKITFSKLYLYLKSFNFMNKNWILKKQKKV